jgi:TfoX/Sxy family transcriptional regulator of competence genes
VAFDEALAARLRQLLPDSEERRLFGGMCLMERGHLVAGVVGPDLIVRVPPEETSTWLKAPGAHPMRESRGMAGWLKVDARSLKDDASLAGWVRRSRAFTRRLPPK